MSASEKPRVRVWLASDGWRWEYRSKNGTPQATASRAYTRRGDCVGALRSILTGLPAAEISIAEGPARAPSAEKWGSLVVGRERV